MKNCTHFYENFNYFLPKMLKLSVTNNQSICYSTGILTPMGSTSRKTIHRCYCIVTTSMVVTGRLVFWGKVFKGNIDLCFGALRLALFYRPICSEVTKGRLGILAQQAKVSAVGSYKNQNS